MSDRWSIYLDIEGFGRAVASGTMEWMGMLVRLGGMLHGPTSVTPIVARLTRQSTRCLRARAPAN